ncbi:MAG: hypothetical protein V1921_05100 [Candidatus Altiarchaeota archaeon]
MRVSYRSGGGGIHGSPSDDRNFARTTDYSSIAERASERVLNASAVNYFFRDKFSILVDRPEVNDRFFKGRSGAEKKPLNIAIAILEAHPGWLKDKEPEGVKRLLEGVADMTEDVNLQDTRCTADEVKAVEATLQLGLEDVGVIEKIDKCRLPAPVEPDAYSRPPRPERRQLLEVSRQHGLTKLVGDVWSAFGKMNVVANPEDAANRLVNDVLNPTILDLPIHGLKFEGDGPRQSINERGIRLFKTFDPPTRVLILDVIETEMDSRQRDGTRNDALQVCANLLDELPARACAEMLTEIEPIKGAMMLELMRPENAANSVERLLKNRDPVVVHKGGSLMRYIHRDVGEDIRGRLGKSALKNL